jgi:nucleotide-binding universal stress UspA family protein
MFKTIIWATDGSANADHALALARELALASSCPLVAVHSKELLVGRAGGYPLLADEEDIETKIARQVQEAKDDGIDARTVIAGGHVGHAAQTIADTAASADADLIILGTRGQTPLAGLMLGSVAQRLLHVAPCPVLAVPPSAHIDAATGTKTLETVS